MSLASLAFIAFLLVYGGPSVPQSTLYVIASGVIGYWFGSGIANRFGLSQSTQPAPVQVVTPTATVVGVTTPVVAPVQPSPSTDASQPPQQHGG